MIWVALRDEQDDPSTVLGISRDLTLAKILCQSDAGQAIALDWRSDSTGHVHEAVGRSYRSYRVEGHVIREDQQ